MDVIKIVENKRKCFFSFSNQDGKRWTVPLKNTKVALELYEPSSQKGKLVKAVLPYGISLSPFTAFFNGSYQDVTLGEKLKKIISRTFGTAFQFSIFWGTPCVDQKITIQIFRGKRILGYCKLGKSERVRTLFFHEDKVLRILQERGIEHVPVSYGVTLVDDGYYAFLQSTEKLIMTEFSTLIPRKCGPAAPAILSPVFPTPTDGEGSSEITEEWLSTA